MRGPGGSFIASTLTEVLADILTRVSQPTASTPRLVRSDQLPEHTGELGLGGKGGKLAELSRDGFPVPPWVCLTTATYDAADGGDLSAADQDALLKAFDSLFAEGVRVAVRSSAMGEDGAQDSFAGQLDTYLHVTRESVAERVRDCFASASSPGVTLYRKVRGLDGAPPRTAVVVQLMVDSTVAGVLFTANPASGDRAEAVVTAGLGLGEGIVADLVETDTYRLTLADGSIRERQIGEKRSRIAFDVESGQGTLTEAVLADIGDAPCLSDDQLAALCDLGRRLQERFGEPQDIEFAFDAAGTLHLLQARPITTLESELIFDNSNIVESYPGLCSPLTYSFARRCYEEIFRESSRLFGVSPDVLRRKHSVHANLLALVSGRIYYNILNWYELFLFVPGFEGLLPAWERALGLPPRFVQQREPGKFGDKAWAVWRALRRFQTLSKDVETFQDDFNALLAEFRERDLTRLDPQELYALFEELCLRFLRPYAVSLGNDMYAQQFYDQLGKVIEKWDLADDPSSLRNNLLCGESGMDSVEPIRSILALVGQIRKDDTLRALFDSNADALDVWAAIHEREEFVSFRGALSTHLDAYGDRTLHELKLETPSAREDPGFVVTMLRNYLRGGQNTAAMEEREHSIRSEAEAQLAKGLAGRPVRKRLFAWLLKNTRLTVTYRENLRLSRSRSAGMAKKIFRTLGERFAAKGILADPKDVFWLTVDEVEAQIRGHAVSRDLRSLVALRAAEYEAFATAPAPPSRVVTQGLVYTNLLTRPRNERFASGDLVGVGCSPGVVRARAKVITDPRSDLRIDGEILVSPMTDPGWVFLMVAAGGLVVERGSLLSHTAIIGRELGIPTVVGVANATRRIKDGDLIELDGQAGTVRIVEEGED
jgi:rifampicin phosphotransferase